MELTVGELLKRIRVLNNLTQQQFAKKFAITKATLCNYENNARNPSFDFINAVCKEFDYELDYFKLKSIEESKSEDLIVKRKNDKEAIYDKRQKLYLTPFIYDRIDLSEKYHIIKKFKNNPDSDSLGVYYSAVIDNNGNIIRELDDFIFWGAFRGDVCSVLKKHPSNYNYSHTKNDEFLYDINKGIISEGYGGIYPAIFQLDDIDLGISNYWKKYYIFKHNPLGKRISKRLFNSTDFWTCRRNIEYEYSSCGITPIQVDLLYKDGTIVSFGEVVFKPFDNNLYAQKCLKLLEKYGPELIYFIDIQRFSSFYISKISSSILKYAENNNLIDKDLMLCLDKMMMCLIFQREHLEAPLYNYSDIVCSNDIPELNIKYKFEKIEYKNLILDIPKIFSNFFD